MASCIYATFVEGGAIITCSGKKSAAQQHLFSPSNRKKPPCRRTQELIRSEVVGLLGTAALQRAATFTSQCFWLSRNALGPVLVAEPRLEYRIPSPEEDWPGGGGVRPHPSIRHETPVARSEITRPVRKCASTRPVPRLPAFVFNLGCT